LLDTVILLKRPADYNPSQGARFEVHFEKCRNLHGRDVNPFEARLDTSPNGTQAWTTCAVDALANEEMIELAVQGATHAEIARQLGCNRSTVKRRLDKAGAEGQYTPAARLKNAKRGKTGSNG